MGKGRKVTNAEKKQATSEIYKSSVFLICLTNSGVCLQCYACGVKRRKAGKESHPDVSRQVLQGGRTGTAVSTRARRLTTTAKAST